MMKSEMKNRTLYIIIKALKVKDKMETFIKRTTKINQIKQFVCFHIFRHSAYYLFAQINS
jgi:hypothetical protein